MANVDVFFKYDGKNLLYSNEEDGNYEIAHPETMTFECQPGDTVSFQGLDGIDKLNKIVDGCQGSKRLLKKVKTIFVYEMADCQKGDETKYDVTFKTTREFGKRKVTVDPKGKRGDGG